MGCVQSPVPTAPPPTTVEPNTPRVENIAPASTPETPAQEHTPLPTPEPEIPAQDIQSADIRSTIVETDPCVPPEEPPLPPPYLVHYEAVDGLLSEFVDDIGFVDYKALRRQRVRLKTILRTFANQDPADYATWPEDNQIAFWLNAYNLHALKIVVDHYPIQGSRWLNMTYGPDSLRHIKGFKTHFKFLVMDEEFTLAGIENRIINQRFCDPRLYFALAQQTYSSPPLTRRAYRGAQLWERVEAQTQAYLNSEHGVRIQRERQKVWLPALFSVMGDCLPETYGVDRKFKDFPTFERAILHFVSRYVPPADQRYLETGNYRIHYHAYNWRLNDRSW